MNASVLQMKQIYQLKHAVRLCQICIHC